jgi:nucleotide-binding universal stress UspA family protein
MGRDGRHRIVVGVEGSPGSAAALRWSIEEARLRSGIVEVVTAYLPTYVPAAPDFGYVPLDPVDLVDEVRKMQDEIIATVGDEVDIAGVRIEQKLLKGRSADTLIAAAEGADMLVVGNRGRGGFRGLLLGSVSQQIAHHATCPVVIVRADMDLDEGPSFR